LKKLNIRKPYILFGASAGATSAQLYRLRYSNEICACILYDPTPSNVISSLNSPFRDEFLKAPKIYQTMATCANIGIIRPLIPLMSLLPGEFAEIFRKLPKAHIALFMTKIVLLKTGNHFRYWTLIMDESINIINNYNNHNDQKNSMIGQQIFNTPLLVVGALAWKQSHGKMTPHQINIWWRENQQFLVQTSNNSGYVARYDYDHGACMLDMKLASNCIQSVLGQIKK